MTTAAELQSKNRVAKKLLLQQRVSKAEQLFKDEAPPSPPAAAAPPAPARVADFQGIPVHVDRPTGYRHQGTDSKGKPWTRVYHVDYGFIPNTAGGDGEGLDVFLGHDTQSDRAFWVLQTKVGPTGEMVFDEYKLMLGFTDVDSAKGMYTAHVPRKFFGSICETSISMVRALLGQQPNELMKALAGFITDRNLLVRNEPGSKEAAARMWMLDRVGKGAARIQKAADPAGLDYEVVPEKEPRMDAISPADHAREDEEFPNRQDGFTAYLKNGANIGAWGTTEHDAVRGLLQYVAQEAPGWAAGEPPQTPPPDAAPKTAQAKRVDALVESIARSVEATFASGDGLLPLRKAEGSGKELQYALGIVLEPEVVDAQGEIYDEETIRIAAWDYLARFQNIGHMHKGLVNGHVRLVESYVAPVDMVIEGESVKRGTWLLGVQVLDTEMWKRVRDGQLGGLSIGGFARKNPIIT